MLINPFFPFPLQSFNFPFSLVTIVDKFQVANKLQYIYCSDLYGRLARVSFAGVTQPLLNFRPGDSFAVDDSNGALWYVSQGSLYRCMANGANCERIALAYFGLGMFSDGSVLYLEIQGNAFVRLAYVEGHGPKEISRTKNIPASGSWTDLVVAPSGRVAYAYFDDESIFVQIPLSGNVTLLRGVNAQYLLKGSVNVDPADDTGLVFLATPTARWVNVATGNATALSIGRYFKFTTATKCPSDCYLSGSCLSNGKCSCFENHFDSSCSTFCDAQITCNSRGKCSDSGQCICQGMWTGPDCRTPINVNRPAALQTFTAFKVNHTTSSTSEFVDIYFDANRQKVFRGNFAHLLCSLFTSPPPLHSTNLYLLTSLPPPLPSTYPSALVFLYSSDLRHVEIYADRSPANVTIDYALGHSYTWTETSCQVGTPDASQLAPYGLTISAKATQPNIPCLPGLTCTSWQDLDKTWLMINESGLPLSVRSSTGEMWTFNPSSFNTAAPPASIFLLPPSCLGK